MSEDSNCSTFSPELIFWFYFNFSNSSGYEASHCGFELHFPNDWRFWVSFDVLCKHLYIFFEKCLFKYFDHFCSELFTYCWALKFIYVFWIQSFIRYTIHKYFLPFCVISSLFLWSTNFPIWWNLIYFSFGCWCFGVISKNA